MLFKFCIVGLILFFSKSGILNAKQARIAITATVETTPVKHIFDAADDPAIWFHPQQAKESLILGTDKQGGIGAYRLDGQQVFFYRGHRFNNIDLRYNIPRKNNAPIDIIAASTLDKHSIELFTIKQNPYRLQHIGTRNTDLDAYGLCMHHNRKTQEFSVFVTGQSGNVEYYRLQSIDGKINLRYLKTIEILGKTEGCVADDELNYLYIAEEAKGIWKFDLDPSRASKAQLIAQIGSDPFLQKDIEGLSLIYGEGRKGYIIASVQSKNSFAIYQRTPPHSLIDTFKISRSDDIDKVTHTDGIDVLGASLGPRFPFGVFIAQDDRNRQRRFGFKNQNFKLVPWQHIATSLNLPKSLGLRWNPRQ